MNISAITQDPMLLLELGALVLTTLHLTRLVFFASYTGRSGRTIAALQDSMICDNRSIPSRIKSIFDVGNLVSLPKRSLRYQHPSFRL